LVRDRQSRADCARRRSAAHDRRLRRRDAAQGGHDSWLTGRRSGIDTSIGEPLDGEEGRKSMKKAFAGGLAVIAVLLVGMFTGAARASEGGNLDCSEAWSLCAEPESSIGYNGEYTGHDEPALLFYSNRAGSGNSSVYDLTLPEESRVMPNQAGTGGTWNFQLRPAFWLGMALCDNQSAPEFTHAACTPDSDTNIKNGSDPAAADYIGRHPGAAFPGADFYPPGWAPWPPGV